MYNKEKSGGFFWLFNFCVFIQWEFFYNNIYFIDEGFFYDLRFI